MTTQVYQVGWEAPPRLDLRYEVTHKPTAAMWEAMMAVTPGMASSGQDPIVNELEARVAALTGHEAALLLPSTTNGTVLAFMTHDVRGQIAIMEAKCHIYWVERLHVSQFAGAAPSSRAGRQVWRHVPTGGRGGHHRDGLWLSTGDRVGLPGEHPQRLWRDDPDTRVHA